MRGAPSRLDLHPHEALVRDDEAELGRLGDDCSVRPATARDRLGPDGVGLLVHDGRDEHVAAQACPDRLGARDHDRREAPFHVVGSTTVQPPVLDARLERRLHAFVADRVHVRVQEERRAAAGATGAADDVGPAGRNLLHLDLEPGIREPLGHEARQLTLARTARNEVGVDGVDPNELGGELSKARRTQLERRRLR